MLEGHGGTKLDDGKSRHDLIPAESIEAVARVFTYGVAKYSDRNWENGIAYGRVYAATMRHLTKWWRGQRCDTESGMPHLWHAATNLMMLTAFEIRRMGNKWDDRQVTIQDQALDSLMIAPEKDAAPKS